jgi:hypothetical protein
MATPNAIRLAIMLASARLRFTAGTVPHGPAASALIWVQLRQRGSSQHRKVRSRTGCVK